MRQRYYVFISVAYVVVGLIIVARSVLAHVFQIAFLGLVFIALGVVRLRSYYLTPDPR